MILGYSGTRLSMDQRPKIQALLSVLQSSKGTRVKNEINDIRNPSNVKSSSSLSDTKEALEE